MSESDRIPPERLRLYDELVASRPDVERKGASMPYTAVNGHMFSFLMPSGRVALRLPEPERGAFLATHDTTLCEQHGRVLKEYVEVPDRLLEEIATLKPYFDRSYAYVSSLRPKPTRRTG